MHWNLKLIMQVIKLNKLAEAGIYGLLRCNCFLQVHKQAKVLYASSGILQANLFYICSHTYLSYF